MKMDREDRANAREKAEKAVHAVCVGCMMKAVDGVTPWERMWLSVPLSDKTILDIPVCLKDEEEDCRHTWHTEDGTEWRNFRPVSDLVRVVGPDGKPYLFPAGTTKADAISYFKTKDKAALNAKTSASSPEQQQPTPANRVVRIGDTDQVAIEKDYWTAYKNSRHHDFAGEMLGSLLLGLLGFPAGLALWIFYRLVVFAVKG
jgi:hypothetical protein